MYVKQTVDVLSRDEPFTDCTAFPIYIGISLKSFVWSRMNEKFIIDQIKV